MVLKVEPVTLSGRTMLRKHLETIANRSNLQEAGIVRPYLAKWDAAPYPSKFKASTLHTFNGKGSLNQHIYYFKSQTGSAVSSDAIMAHLVISTLKLVALEWFIKIPIDSIKTWDRPQEAVSGSLLRG